MATETITAAPIELEEYNHPPATSKLPSVNIRPSSTGRAPCSNDIASPGASSEPAPAVEAEPPKLSTTKAWVVITQLCGNSFINSFSAGVLMVCLPTMAADLHIPHNLLLWPTSVTFLASAATQLISGSIADTLGPRRINTLGSFLQSVFIIATGLAQNGYQLIVFRTLQGVSTSLFTPSGRSMLSTRIERGKLRNFAFAAMILAFPLGAGLGLVLGGVYADNSSWRVSYYSSGAIGLLLSMTGLWTLPRDLRKHGSYAEAWKRLTTEIDWIGAVIASGSLTLLSYVLAMLSASTDEIHQPVNIALLTISLACIPGFALWMEHRRKVQKPALIPNTLWTNSTFTCVCLMIALSNAAQGCLSFFVSLFFQEVQMLSPYQASIRLLPQAIVGTLMCLLVGVFVSRMTPYWGIVSTMGINSLSPLLMAITNPAWPYWYTAFWAQVLGPLSIDVMFVVGALVVADAFSGTAQARGSAVFGMFSQLGSSIGLCITSVISNSVIDQSGPADQASPDALLKGYRSSFWTQFAWILASMLIGAVGLRKLGRVGMKRD